MSDSHYEPIINAEGELCGFVKRPGPGLIPASRRRDYERLWNADTGTARVAIRSLPQPAPSGVPYSPLISAEPTPPPPHGFASQTGDSECCAVSAQTPAPVAYRHYRDRYIATGEPADLRSMLDHVTADTGPMPEPKPPTPARPRSIPQAAVITACMIMVVVSRVVLHNLLAAMLFLALEAAACIMFWRRR